MVVGVRNELSELGVVLAAEEEVQYGLYDHRSREGGGLGELGVRPLTIDLEDLAFRVVFAGFVVDYTVDFGELPGILIDCPTDHAAIQLVLVQEILCLLDSFDPSIECKVQMREILL